MIRPRTLFHAIQQGRPCLMRWFRPLIRHHQRIERPSLATSCSPFSTSSQSPSNPSSTWQRSAKLVKNTDVTNPYLDQVRSEVADPALQLKSIEDELCGAIGKALGKQGEKILFAIREMKVEHTQYLEHLQAQASEKALQCATRHNDARTRAIKARWELLVHRQAVGFTVDNHSVIHSTFPITEPLPVDKEEIATMIPAEGEDEPRPEVERSAEQPKKKVWGDQLDWWQSVGRWK